MFTHTFAAYSLVKDGAKIANQSSSCHDSLRIREKLVSVVYMTENKCPGKF
jgi:hypothetical protein